MRESIQLLQKVFQLRTCEDTVFANRSRPCLLHQIKRCTAPCVKLITPEAYARDVSAAAQLLHGEASALTELITEQMNAAAASLDFEAAAHLRDRMRMLATVREKQFVDTTGGEADADVIAVAEAGGRDRGQPHHDPRRPPSWRPQLLPAARRRRDARPKRWKPSSASTTSSTRSRRAF